jgi:hypothetical protein
MNRREFLCRRRYSRDADRSALGRSGATIQDRVCHIRGAEPATTWAGDRFRGFTEAREIGFHSAETCATSFREFYPDDVASLRKRMDEIGVPFAAITAALRAATRPWRTRRGVKR